MKYFTKPTLGTYQVLRRPVILVNTNDSPHTHTYNSRVVHSENVIMN